MENPVATTRVTSSPLLYPAVDENTHGDALVALNPTLACPATTGSNHSMMVMPPASGG